MRTALVLSVAWQVFYLAFVPVMLLLDRLGTFGHVSPWLIAASAALWGFTVRDVFSRIGRMVDAWLAIDVVE